MAINNKPASAYAGRKPTPVKAVDPNTLSSKQVNVSTEAMHAGIGNADKDVKTTGIETRGNGAATKGRMARGPMA